jgi:2-(1,2-epoxy-1,2-dihydrophenyl)acetyl-CoA isomerase
VTYLVLLEQIDQVAVLTLNRPERHNSLTPALLTELLDGLEKIRNRPDVSAVVLQANGKSFSTGGDVRAFYDHREDLESFANQIVSLLNQAILAMFELPVPIVSAVHSIVTGGSLGLVLASDIILLAPEASFTPYYSIVGFSPDGGWTAILPSVVGPKRAGEIILLNQTISAKQAVDWGLASRIVSRDEIRVEALQTAKQLSGMCMHSMRHTKQLLGLTHGDLAARLESERSHFVEQVQTDEARQGMARFLRIEGS